jgi:fructose-specific phosphotransferase system IIA component
MRLTDLLTIDNIKIPLEANRRDQAIEELIDIIKEHVNDSKQALEAVMEREKIMTTGVGNGIAIPHCKHHSCPNFTIALGIAQKGIDFSAIDNQNVKLVFLLLGPENNPGTHIKLLSRISRLMSDEAFRNQLLETQEAKQAHHLLIEQEGSFPEIE